MVNHEFSGQIVRFGLNSLSHGSTTYEIKNKTQHRLSYHVGDGITDLVPFALSFEVSKDETQSRSYVIKCDAVIPRTLETPLGTLVLSKDIKIGSANDKHKQMLVVEHAFHVDLSNDILHYVQGQPAQEVFGAFSHEIQTLETQDPLAQLMKVVKKYKPKANVVPQAEKQVKRWGNHAADQAQTLGKKATKQADHVVKDVKKVFGFRQR